MRDARSRRWRSRGQLQRIPQRGYFVSVVDEGQRRELVEVRVLLETATVPSIVERAAGKDIADLRRLATAFAAAARQGDVKERYMTNRAFHVRLTGLCANRELAKLALAVRGDLPTTPIAQWHSQARIEQSAKEHALIVQALADRDVEEIDRADCRSHPAAGDVTLLIAPRTRRARADGARG